MAAQPSIEAGVRLEEVSCGVPRVLVVDDEAVILFVLHEFLGARGYSVDTAVTAAEAYGLLERFPYEVLITDLRLSGSADREGLDVVRRARSLARRPAAIVLTAYTSRGDASEALDCGAALVLTKPVDLFELERAVAQIAARAR
jgi:NtrC-family two-component system response regulator AlgB